MDARTYLNTYKDPGVQRLVDAVTAAGKRLTIGYFKQIAYGYRRPSFELAEAMVENDPVRKLDLTALMRAKDRRDDDTGGVSATH